VIEEVAGNDVILEEHLQQVTGYGIICFESFCCL